MLQFSILYVQLYIRWMEYGPLNDMENGRVSILINTEKSVFVEKEWKQEVTVWSGISENRN